MRVTVFAQKYRVFVLSARLRGVFCALRDFDVLFVRPVNVECVCMCLEQYGCGNILWQYQCLFADHARFVFFSLLSSSTVVSTSTPANEAELQLYRVLQRASLLAYYDTLLEMGGDDVQQLCDAGEEEFLEIMALVGMASKPLHVRRLQKSLHEWAMSPGSFQAPLSQMGESTADQYLTDKNLIIPFDKSDYKNIFVLNMFTISIN